MILYNVTLNIENEVAEEYVNWMNTVHIPEVMATGLFVSYKMLRLLNEEDNGGTTFAVQYYLEDMDRFEHYQTFHAARLQTETKKRYEGKYVAFRTLLEVVSQS
jgi:hypothetical protein